MQRAKTHLGAEVFILPQHRGLRALIPIAVSNPSIFVGAYLKSLATYEHRLFDNHAFYKVQWQSGWLQWQRVLGFLRPFL